MKKVFNLRIPIELYELLKGNSIKKGLTVNALIIQTLWESIEKNK